MASIKNVSQLPFDLSDGRSVPVGRIAEGVDLDDRVLIALIDAGLALPVDDVTPADSSPPDPPAKTSTTPTKEKA